MGHRQSAADTRQGARAIQRDGRQGATQRANGRPRAPPRPSLLGRHHFLNEAHRPLDDLQSEITVVNRARQFERPGHAPRAFHYVPRLVAAERQVRGAGRASAVVATRADAPFPQQVIQARGCDGIIEPVGGLDPRLYVVFFHVIKRRGETPAVARHSGSERATDTLAFLDLAAFDEHVAKGEYERPVGVFLPFRDDRLEPRTDIEPTGGIRDRHTQVLEHSSFGSVGHTPQARAMPSTLFCLL